MHLKKIIVIGLASLLLQACAHLKSPAMGEELQQGKATFATGDYKTAFQQLLPIAANGNKEAEYAVGYMYYNGLGVAQDNPTGIFWMKQSAAQGYKPAQDALKVVYEGPPLSKTYAH